MSTATTAFDSLAVRRLATPDGAEVAYRLREGRDPWILLHALGCDSTMWRDVVEHFPGDVGLVVPDLRGHGESGLGWRAPGVEVWAADVLDIARRESLGTPAVAGISMGGYTALALAEREPGLARTWGWISTHARDDGDAGRARRAEGLHVLRERGWRSLAAGMMALLLNENDPRFPAHRQRLMEMFARAGDTGLAAALIALANRPDRRAALAGLTTPSVVVHGDADTLVPLERAREIVDAAPRSRLVVLPETGHMSTLEAPDRVAAALLETVS